MGTFQCDVIAGKNSDNAEFVVIRGNGVPLLGRDTSIEVVYHPGKNNIADSLSRLIDVNKAQSNSTNTDEYVRFVAIDATPNAMTTKEVEPASAEDAELKQLRHQYRRMG